MVQPVLPAPEVRRPDRIRLMVPASAVPVRVPELPTDCWRQELVPVRVQQASLVLEYDFELVDPSDWHLLPVERLYPGLADPSDFVRRPVQAVVA